VQDTAVSPGRRIFSQTPVSLMRAHLNEGDVVQALERLFDVEAGGLQDHVQESLRVQSVDLVLHLTAALLSCEREQVDSVPLVAHLGGILCSPTESNIQQSFLTGMSPTVFFEKAQNRGTSTLCVPLSQ